MKTKSLFFSLFFTILGLSLAFSATPQPPTIVIDPGHGGKDPGTVSHRLREKDLALQISRKLAASLKQKTGALVTLTRPGDRFVSLAERNRIATRARCDLFLSIHVNSSRNRRAEGTELYYLNKATDSASRKLAARENEGAPRKEAEIEAIVSDLIQTAATEESAELASLLKKSVRRRLPKQEVRIKTALFYVLVGAKCPSLLVETGFVTHSKEARRLKDPHFQKTLADGIAAGVADFLSRPEERGDL